MADIEERFAGNGEGRFFVALSRIQNRSSTDRLLQLKGGAAYNLVVDLDVYLIGAESQPACT